MFAKKRVPFVIAVTAALLLVACDIEENLRLEFDGSGSYKVRITIPKNLADDFGDLRKEVEKDGFSVSDEGTTETERFIVFRKDFKEVAALNDDHSQFELTVTRRGLLQRDYRFRATLQSVGFGSYQRHFAVTMPCKVTSASNGTVDGSRVTWNASHGGSIEITASGFCLPLSGNQRVLAAAAGLLGIALLIVARRRRQPSQSMPSACPACQSQLASGTRFCRNCGTGAPVAQA